MEDWRNLMTASKTSKVNKLLRVLVVGGVALAGAPAARAEDKPADEQKTAKSAEKAKDAKAKEKDKKDKEKAKEQAAKDKAAEKAEGSGVKGW